MKQVVDVVFQNVGGYLPQLVVALVILSLGLLAAAVVSVLIGLALRRVSLDRRLGRWAYGAEADQEVSVERWVSRIAFFLVLLLVMVAFFEKVGLTLVTEPLRDILRELSRYAPRILGALVLFVLAWVLASAVRFVVLRILNSTGLDRWLRDMFGAGKARTSFVENLAGTAYWLVFLLFVPAFLDALNLQGLLSPVQGMFEQVMGYLPKLVAACLILLIGWFFARILQRVVTNFLTVAGLEKLGDQAGISAVLGKESLSELAGLVVYILVLIPVLIAALNAVALDAITGPATALLSRILEAMGSIFGALLLILVTFMVARVVGRLAASLLVNIGADSLLARIGLGKQPGKGDWTVSEVARTLIVAGLTLMACIEGARMLGFGVVAELIAQFLVFAGQVIIGILIMLVGLYLANLAARAIVASKAEQAGTLAIVARVAIIIFAGAMALRQIGIAGDIINIAFGLLLGSLAVGAALAFGLGGRELAGRKLEEWVQIVGKKRGKP